MAAAAPVEARHPLLRAPREHLQAALSAASSLCARPAATLLTALVMGVPLALSMGLHLAVTELNRLAPAWAAAGQASLYLRDSVDEARGRALEQELAQRPDVAGTRYISREEALAEFRARSGLGAALDALDFNPLPATLIVRPRPELGRAALDQLDAALAARPEVERLDHDHRWLERLRTLLDLLRRAVVLLAAVLGLAAVMTVAQSVRLELEGRREEVRVMKLIGATDAYIARPLLYIGVWYGLLGSFFALLLVEGALLWLGPAAGRLAALYGGTFSRAGPSSGAILALVAAGLALGLLSAGGSARRQLAHVEPG